MKTRPLASFVSLFTLSALTAAVAVHATDAGASWERVPDAGGCTSSAVGITQCAFRQTETLSTSNVAGAYVDVYAWGTEKATVTACSTYYNSLGGSCGNGAVNTYAGYSSLAPSTSVWTSRPLDYPYLNIATSGTGGVFNAVFINGYGVYSN